MYFLSEEERRLLVGKLLPQARQHEVHAELRGWAWREPPLSPPYDTRLGVFEVAGKYCATSRDVYLRRVLNVRAQPNRAMLEGAALHRAVAEIVLEAKQAIYARGAADCLPALALLAQQVPDGGDEAGAADAALAAKALALRQFEARRVVARVEDALARQPRVGTDSLVALALPVTVEQQLDGTFLGLAAHLAADALMAFEPVVFDLKFDRRRDFHRLSTAAYAMVLESLHEHPVDVGCTVYVRFESGRVVLERDLHVIDDELRQWFVEERDERMRMVGEEADPGMPERCAEECPYEVECHRGGGSRAGEGRLAKVRGK